MKKMVSKDNPTPLTIVVSYKMSNDEIIALAERFQIRPIEPSPNSQVIRFKESQVIEALRKYIEDSIESTIHDDLLESLADGDNEYLEIGFEAAKEYLVVME